VDTVDHEDEVEREIDDDQPDRQSDRLAETPQEDRAQHQEQRDRHEYGMPEPVRRERVLDQVRGGVRGRQRDGDHEARGREAEQAEDDDLPLPARKEILEHQDAALPVGAHLGDAVVHRQRAKERQQDEHQRRHRRERPGGHERDAGLIRQRREIVDAGEAHHLPPGGGVGRPHVRPDRRFVAFVEPVVNAAFRERSFEGNPDGGAEHGMKFTTSVCP
jgi:hypothetical protein